MRVLVIEDEPDLIQALREEGYAADRALDGREGLSRAEGCDYDAIVLDLSLPGLDGLEVLRRLRRGKATPVLILTARDGVSDRVRGLDAGADDYLVKPFALSELLARLRALIRRSTGLADPVIRIGDVAINTVTRTVDRAGAEVPLTAREYALVELLALHRGRLITRTVIYDRLFGDDDDTLSNVVEVHVSHIRKKIRACKASENSSWVLKSSMSERRGTDQPACRPWTPDEIGWWSGPGEPDPRVTVAKDWPR